MPSAPVATLAQRVPVVPGNLTNHGLVCEPATVTSVVLFFFTNYLAHCATVKSYPGETSIGTVISIVLALFFPLSGILKAMNSIIRHARLTRHNELQMAARAGALCMVVRSESWEPIEGDAIRDIENSGGKLGILPHFRTGLNSIGNAVLLRAVTRGTRPTAAISIIKPHWMKESLPVNDNLSHYRPITKTTCTIHGIYSLPKGFEFAYIPSDAELSFVAKNIDQSHLICSINIASSYSFAKAVIAVVQALYAAATLYRTRGNQIDRYGYAAFGLTVTPYVIMSILNFFGQIATPDYPALYMVRSEIMTEAERRGGYFHGEVGHLSSVNCLFGATSFVGRVEEFHNNRALNSEFLKISIQQQDSTDGPSFLAIYRHRDQNSEDQIFPRRAPNLLEIPACPRFKKAKPDGIYDYVEFRARLLFWTPLALSSISLLLIGILSHFQKGGSSRAQRAWTMTWLIVGMVTGLLGPKFWKTFAVQLDEVWTGTSIIGGIYNGFITVIGLGILFGAFFAPAIGGFIVVAQMLYDYGSCIRI